MYKFKNFIIYDIKSGIYFKKKRLQIHYSINDDFIKIVYDGLFYKRYNLYEETLTIITGYISDKVHEIKYKCITPDGIVIEKNDKTLIILNGKIQYSYGSVIMQQKLSY